MKNITFYATILSLSVCLFSCKKKEKLPPVLATVEEAKKLLSDKTWQVVDVATVEGQSIFDNDKTKSERIVPPVTEALTWLSTKEGAKKNSDFTSTFYKDNLKISIALNNDSVATTTGLEADKQIFSINNGTEENEPKGIKLTLTGESKSFAEMGVNKATTTYYILGANENKLYLLTPNKINSLKVVFLLESK